MDAKLKQDWIDALRSGKYRQGRGRLCDDSSRYCCLGVLCAIQEPPDVSPDGTRTWDYNPGYIPHRLSAGLRTSHKMRLMKMNDNGGSSFTEIADWIERNVPSDG